MSPAGNFSEREVGHAHDPRDRRSGRQDPDRRLLAQWLAMSFAGYYSVDSAEGLAYQNQLAERHARYIAEKVVEGFPQ